MWREGVSVWKELKVSLITICRNIDDYTHPIGRTRKAAKEGTATSFITKEDTEIMSDLKKMLLKTKNEIPRELMAAEVASKDPRIL